MLGSDRIDALEVAVFRVPLDAPEADGTLTWDHTTVVTTTARCGGLTGLGLTYGSPACATVIREQLAPVVIGSSGGDPPAAWHAMVRAIRNDGRPGIVSMGIAAVDIALWDLAAKLAGRPLCQLLGQLRRSVPIYGSGGFTSLRTRDLVEQLTGWVDQGIPRVKMKVATSWGTMPERDLVRVAEVRRAIGETSALFVDANGGYRPKQAARLAPAFEDEGVSWFEEPVSSDHVEVLARIRRQTRMDVAAGEYGYDLAYFSNLCRAGAVDVVQIDVSRCAGITEWRRIAALASGHGLEVSGHCAPSLHVAVACSTPNVAHLEYFADHARADRLLFDGVVDPVAGELEPDRSVPGHGLSIAGRADRWRTA